MRIKNLFHRNKKLQVGKFMTLEQAKKYEKNEKYKDYIFPVVGMENGKVMCRMQRKEDSINFNRNKREASFEEYVIAGGKYKGTHQNVREGKTEIASSTQYNNW